MANGAKWSAFAPPTISAMTSAACPNGDTHARWYC